MKTIKILFVLVSMALFFSCNKDKETTELLTSTPPFASGLSFQKIKDLPNNYYDHQAVGFLANQANSSLYISCRDINFLQSETIHKYNTIDQSLITKNTPIKDFATKRNYIYNNQLYVFGSQKVSIYDLNLNSSLNTIPYPDNSSYSRFGFAAQNNNIYFVGGFLGGSAMSPDYDKKLVNYDIVTNVFATAAFMPINRNGGSSEFVNNKLYTFFGYEWMFDPAFLNNIRFLNDALIFDISTSSFQALPLASNIKYSYTAKYNNYIFVAGNKYADSLSSTVVGSFFGYFNTDTNIMIEIPITVQENNFAFPYICEIEITEIYPDLSVGRVIESTRNGNIEREDNVTTKL